MGMKPLKGDGKKVRVYNEIITALICKITGWNKKMVMTILKDARYAEHNGVNQMYDDIEKAMNAYHFSKMN